MSPNEQTYYNHPGQFNRNINKYFNLYIAVIDYYYGSFDRRSAGKKTSFSGRSHTFTIAHVRPQRPQCCVQPQC